MVFYRKYRPQTIAELDSEEIRQKLYSVFSDLSNIPHAYLFTGPKGLGKTSTARIIAKVVNCEKKLKVENGKLKIKREKNSQLSTLNSQLNIEPCNECHQCISITNGTNMDIMEIDGASNRGIDEIRDLREKIKLAPLSASKKVYIIDEVHMLTTEAFNALLKTLEEPPPHVMFILCTTEQHKVPPTILSRCFHISFRLATKEELLSSFKRISKEEKLDIDEDALEYIASISDGSFRDGVKVLDELASMSRSSNNAKITKETIEEKFQISNFKFQISKILEHLEKKDTKEALKLVSELVKTGIDMKYFIEKLVGELHSILLIQVGVEDVNSKFKVQSSKLETGELKNLIELFTRAYGELKYAVLPQIPLEIAIIEWTTQQSQKNAEEIPHLNPLPLIKREETERVISPLFRKRGEIKRGDENAVQSSSVLDTNGKQNNDGIWTQFIDQVKVHNHSLAGILRGCVLKSHDEKDFIIETAYKFHRDKLSENKSMEVLEKVIAEISGKPVRVEVVLKAK